MNQLRQTFVEELISKIDFDKLFLESLSRVSWLNLLATLRNSLAESVICE